MRQFKVLKTFLMIGGLPGLCMGTAWAATADSANAAAESSLEEVVVTAEHRESSVQRAPLAITVIDGDKVARGGGSDIAQILQDVPSLVMQNVSGGMSTQSVQGSGAPPNIAIRGLGTDGPNRSGAVALYQDGILLQGGGGNSYDINRVEVLRGPQGTLYGRGATAGAVNFITNDPGKAFEASGRVQVGNYGLIGTQGVLNVPLSDTWSVRAAFNQVKHRGYFENGQSDEDSVSARIKLRYSPSERLSLTLGSVLYESDSTSPGAVDIRTNPVPSDWITGLAGGTKVPNSYRKYFADVEADLGFADLTYLAGYQTSHSYFASYCNCFGNPAGTYVVVDSPYNKTQTHELRLASKATGPLTWVAGVYYYHLQMQQQFRLSVLPPAVGAADSPFTTNLQHYSPKSTAGFGELTWAVSDRTRITGGVRHTRDNVVQDQLSVGGPPSPLLSVDASITHTDWKARVEHDLTAGHLLYGAVSTGYRPGAVVQGLLTASETVRSYEVGSKNRIGTRTLLNAAAFYYDYSGFQNVLSQPVGNTVVTSVIPIPAKFYGVELEGTVQLSFNDKLTFAPSFLSAKYTDSCATCVVGMGPNPNAPSPLLTKNGPIPHAPGITMSVDYQHTFALVDGGTLVWDIDGHHQSQSITDFDASNYQVVNPGYANANPRFLQGGYSVLNTALTFAPKDQKYRISAYVRNLNNKIYKTAAGNGVAGGAFFVNDPRTFGVTLSARLE
jgi:iron complex outermembrane recepter protein